MSLLEGIVICKLWFCVVTRVESRENFEKLLENLQSVECIMEKGAVCVWFLCLRFCGCLHEHAEQRADGVVGSLLNASRRIRAADILFIEPFFAFARFDALV